MKSFPNRLAALLLSTLLLSACGQEKPPVADDITTDGPGTTDAPIVTVAPTTDPVAPTTTAPETTAPPAETTAPPQTAPAAPITGSGRFSSETGSNLEIHLDWAVIGSTADTATLRVDATVTHYEIWVSARQGGKLTVGNTSQTFATEAIEHNERKKMTVPLTSATVDIPLGADGTADVELFVSWPFIGTYSGVKIDNLTCGGTVHLSRDAVSAQPTETTAKPVTTAKPAETTAKPAETTAPADNALLFSAERFIGRNAAHFGAVTLLRSTTDRDAVIAAHDVGCTNAACAALVASLKARDAAFFAANAILLVPQGNRMAGDAPLEVFSVEDDAGAVYLHIRDLAASKTATPLTATRFCVQAISIPADAIGTRTINVVQHGTYYLDTKTYADPAAVVTRAYAPDRIKP